MNKKALIFTSVVSLTAIGFVTAFAARQQLVKRANAEECEHSVVEHYEASETSIEHWACCSCHHAWADAAKTIEVSENTTADRVRIDTVAYYNHSTESSDWVWDNSLKAIYDEEQNFAYAVDYTDVKQSYIQTSDLSSTLENGKSFTIKATNNTDKVLTAYLTDRNWGHGLAAVEINIGESKYFNGTSTLWNAHEVKKGFCLHLAPSEGGTFNGSVTITKVVIGDNYYNCSSQKDSWEWDGATYLVPNERFGFAQKAILDNVKQAFVQTIDTSSVLDNNHVFFVEVTNKTAKTISVYLCDRGWENGKAPVSIGVGETKTLCAGVELWNANANKGFAVAIKASDSSRLSGDVVVTKAFVQEQYFGYIEAANQDTGIWEVLPQEFVYEETLSAYSVCFDASVATGTLRIYIKNRIAIDSSLYSGFNLHVYNGGTVNSNNVNIVNEDWGSGGYSHVDSIAPNSWGTGLLRAATWNGDSEGSVNLGFYDMTFNGLVKIYVGSLVAL